MKAAHHAAKGHAKKHAHAHKHVRHHHAKHHPKHHKKPHHAHHKAKVHTVGHHQAHAKGLAQAPGDVACCVSQALAASLRLQGLPVTGADVLALHRAAGADDDRGAPVLAVLEAASEAGLAGVRPVRYDLHSGDAAVLAERDVFGVDDLDFAAFAVEAGAFPPVQREPFLHRPVRQAFDDHSLILGVDLPGHHTVLATPEGWWSWGELFCPWCDFPDAVVDEAWVIAWQ